MTAEQIIAAGEAFTTVTAALIAIWTYFGSARRDEITRLTSRVVCLENENQDLHKQLLALREENMWLRLVLANRGIKIPPMPSASAVPDLGEPKTT